MHARTHPRIAPTARFCLLLILFVAFLAGMSSAGEVEIEISGFKGKKGDLRVAVFDSESTFLDRERMRAGHRVRADAIAGEKRVLVSFHNLQPGRYAVSAFHDTNSNGETDKNMLGIPTEGYGFSNAAKGRMGPPSFQDAAFEVGSELLRIKIEMKYP